MSKFFKQKDPLKNPSDFFQVGHIASDLKGRSVRSSIVTVVNQSLKLILQIGSLSILARLLAPEDYGLIGMVNIFVVFAGLFNDFGLSTATIQRSEVSHQQISTLFWISAALGCLIALILVLIAPLIASFYREPRLLQITFVLSVNFILAGLTSQHQALLNRQMRFVSIATIQVCSMSTGLSIALIAATSGMGYWSLVWMQSGSALVNLIGVWIACGWRPGRPFLNSGVRSMFIFGSRLTGFHLFDYFSRNLDNLLIGRAAGTQQLGFYAKAYQLLLLPSQQVTIPITSVAMSALSRLQDSPSEYRAFYYKAQLSIAALGMPIVAFMFASADKVILLILGKQWLGIIPIFQYLTPAAFIETFVWTGWVYLSLGRADRMLRWGIIESTITVISFLIGIHWGVTGVAIAYSTSRLLLVVPTFAYCFSGTALRLDELAITLSRPLVASFAALAAVISINQLTQTDLNILLGLLIDGSLFSMVYLLAWLIIPGGKDILLDTFNTIKNLKK